MFTEGVIPRQIIAVGGGTKNLAWMQIIADIANIRLLIPDQQMGASYGDAFMAGVGVGIFTSQSEINKWVKHTRVIEPCVENHARYEPLYRIYNNLYWSTRDQMKDLTVFVKTNSDLR